MELRSDVLRGRGIATGLCCPSKLVVRPPRIPPETARKRLLPTQVRH